ncbi:hypothetical protein [Dehalobacter sp. TeCB1]|jgi:hypothetical protein|uniref:hypothetical protein n=1 Tax=Dehalobacter sp. TeCB1 TaxID=1843715 RepID=UPI00159F1C46|nr:hypothetical protein [Dehalobacter sp. TeCB1]
MKNNDLTPCDLIECIDCYGYGVCEKTKEKVNLDDPLILEGLCKEIFGINLEEIRKSFK